MLCKINILLSIIKIEGLQLEGCKFDGKSLSENERDSASVSSVPVCTLAWMPKVSEKSKIYLMRLAFRIIDIDEK